MLEIGNKAAQGLPGYAPQPPPHTAYFAPAAPTFQAQQPPQKIAFQPPTQETQWIPAQHNQGGYAQPTNQQWHTTGQQGQHP